MTLSPVFLEHDDLCWVCGWPVAYHTRDVKKNETLVWFESYDSKGNKMSGTMSVWEDGRALMNIGRKCERAPKEFVEATNERRKKLLASRR